MKKLGWYVVSLGVATFILGGILLLVLNLYVESRAVQHRIKEALGARLRMPVSVRKTTFTPWDGLRIDGLEARPRLDAKPAADAAVNEATFLTANSFRVQFALGSLVQNRFVVEDVLLDCPRLSWAQDKGNRWRLPSDEEGLSSSPSENPPPGQTPPPDLLKPHRLPGQKSTSSAAAPAGTEQDSVSTTSGKRIVAGLPKDSNSQFSLERLRVRHGNMDFLNHRRGLLGRFEEVNVDGHLTDPEHVRGRASVEKATLPRAGLKLSHFQTGFVYDQQTGLSLPDVSASLAGGLLAAEYHLRTGEAGSPFDVHCQVENISVGRFIKDAGGKMGFVDGRLRGSLDLGGFADDPEQCKAVGQFELIDTRLRNFPLLEAVGVALHIDDLQQLRFQTAKLSYRLDGNTLYVEPLVLVSNDLQIMAQGNYRLREDRLDVHARLVIDEAVGRQLPRQLQQRFSLCGDEAPGSRYVDFDVGGPLAKPTSNLYERLMPHSINELLSGMLRRRPRRPKELSPPRDDEDTPPAQPTPKDEL